jgi:hypothetical protein
MRLVALLLLVAGAAGFPPASAQLAEDEVSQAARDLVFADREAAGEALSALVATGDLSVAPILIKAMRFSSLSRTAVSDALGELTGEEGNDGWIAWMEWQEANPQIAPHPAFAGFQRGLFAAIDPRFLEFLPDGVDHEIRLEEIVWGGVRVDGIPALIDPELIAPEEADYLFPDDEVFGVEINGDARAYPLRILNWHEMFNDVVGGVPVSLAYCTLCGAGILFETTVEGREEPFVFGSSGFLYRSNKLMYDTATDSLWNQFTGRPVVGPLAGSGIELEILPVAIASWEDWLERHPDTRVLSLDTGHRRDYRPGAAYSEYFASAELMFPALVRDEALHQKQQVFGIRAPGGAKAWPLDAFADGAVINDRVGLTDVVLVGDAATRTVRAYERGDRRFAPTGQPGRLAADGALWTVEEGALVSDAGERLERVPGHLAYWFAWAGYLQDADLYDPARDGAPLRAN